MTFLVLVISSTVTFRGYRVVISLRYIA